MEMNNEIKNSFLLLKNIEKLLSKISAEQYVKLLNGTGELCYRDSDGEVGLKTRKKAAVKKEYAEAELQELLQKMSAMHELAELKKFVQQSKFDKGILVAIAEKAGVKCMSKDTKDRVIEKLHMGLTSFAANWSIMRQGVEEK